MTPEQLLKLFGPPKKIQIPMIIISTPTKQVLKIVAITAVITLVFVGVVYLIRRDGVNTSGPYQAPKLVKRDIPKSSKQESSDDKMDDAQDEQLKPEKGDLTT